MSAHADDLRYFYSEHLGDTREATCTAGVSTEIGDEPLEPGRYMLRVLDFDGAASVWVRFGRHSEVEAAASAPSTQFLGHVNTHDLNKPLLVFMVRQGDDVPNAIAVLSVGGDARVQITKISRDRT